MTSEFRGTRPVRKGPSLAVTLGPVSTTGDEIRKARLERGWSQDELGRRAKVSGKTIGRIERDQDYKDNRSLPAVRAALGLDEVGYDIETIPAADLAAELIRRLMAAERILDRDRRDPAVARAAGRPELRPDFQSGMSAPMPDHLAPPHTRGRRADNG